jgi:hypothetical protein
MPAVWDIDTSEWDYTLRLAKEKPSVPGQIRAAKEARQENSPPAPKKSGRIDEPEL